MLGPGQLELYRLTKGARVDERLVFDAGGSRLLTNSRLGIRNKVSVSDHHPHVAGRLSPYDLETPDRVDLAEQRRTKGHHHVLAVVVVFPESPTQERPLGDTPGSELVPPSDLRNSLPVFRVRGNTRTPNDYYEKDALSEVEEPVA